MQLRDRLKGMEKDYIFFLLAVICVGIGQSVDSAVLNNFLKENFHFAVLQRTVLEMPRELPGLLVFIFTGILFALGDVRIAALSNLAAAVGMFLLGVIPNNLFIMLMVIFIYSSGQHIFLTLFNTIGMSFAEQGQVGRKLGSLNAANNLALVVSSAILWALFQFLHITYTVSFTLGAISFLLAFFLIGRMNKRRTPPQTNRFVFRKEYRLFYWLSILYGARKQIFLTFAPWILVDVFQQKVTTMTILFFIIAVLGIFLKPLIGYLIDSVGEKFVLSAEAFLLFFICLVYAYAENLFPGFWAVVVVAVCFILDQSLSAVSMARFTYIRKIAVKAEDISPTLSLGISLDHLVSMIIPMTGGYIWYLSGAGGYKYVFLGGALISLINFFSVRLLKIEKPGLKAES